MYASTSPSSGQAPRQVAPHQRVKAVAAVSFKHAHAKTSLDTLYQQGSAKIRFPKVYDDYLEAVLINTAGGLTGGDKLDWNLKLGESTQVVATTQACEKAYRSSEGTAQLTTHIHLEIGSTLHWLPQETILYEASNLSRNFSVTMERGATLLAIEAVMLGREAMGETLETLSFKDQWRIKKEGTLVFADNIKLEDRALSTAQLNGNAAFVSLLYVGNEDDEQLEVMVQKLRAICRHQTAAFSAFEGKITARFLAADTYELRKMIIPVINTMRSAPLPRVWRI